MTSCHKVTTQRVSEHRVSEDETRIYNLGGLSKVQKTSVAGGAGALSAVCQSNRIDSLHSGKLLCSCT